MAPVTLVESLALAGMVVCTAVSFFFALAESALFSLGRWRTQQLAEERKEGGEQIAQLLQEPEDLLAAIVLGNTLAVGAIVGIALWFGLAGHWPLATTIGGTLLLILIGGEIVPKTLGARAPERWAFRLVRPIMVVKGLTLPVRQVARTVDRAILRALIPKSWKPQTTLTEEEYQELLELAYQQGGLGRSERDLILQIIRLDRRTVKDVMKPRAQMACIPDDLPIEEMVVAARKFKHQRVPIYDETPDTIVGILNTRALLLDPQPDLAEAIELPSFVPESMNLLQLFRSLQRQRRGMGIVLDEFGGTAGLVTTEDILEEVVGEIHGEGEAEGFAIEKLGPGRWRVNGMLRLEEFRPQYPELGEVRGVDTVGGLILIQLGVVPGQGESIQFRGLKWTASLVDERRVREVLIETLKKRGGG